MSFVDQIINGHRAALRTLAITWYHKALLFYVLLKLIIGSLVVGIASLLLGIGGFGIYKVLHRWITTLVITEGLYVLIAAFIVLVLNIWIAMIFDVALLRRVMAVLNRKDLTFSKSFDFDKGMSTKLFWWSTIIIIVAALIIVVGAMFPPLVRNYVASLSLIILFIGTLFVLPIFIKRNFPIGKAIQRSFSLAWQQLIEIISASISLFFYMLLIGFIVAFVGYGVTWLICYMLSVPFGIGLIMPFVLITVVPGLLLSWYFATVITSLPATLYHSAVDKLR